MNSQKIAGYLCILEPKEKIQRLPFYFGENIIGRVDKKSNIVIKQTSISQAHARLYVTDKTITIMDLGSKNGVKINTEENWLQKEKEVTLEESYVIYLAQFKCKLERVSQKLEVVKPQEDDASKSRMMKRVELLEILADEEVAESAKKNQNADNKVEMKKELSNQKDQKEKKSHQTLVSGKNNKSTTGLTKNQKPKLNLSDQQDKKPVSLQTKADKKPKNEDKKEAKNPKNKQKEKTKEQQKEKERQRQKQVELNKQKQRQRQRQRQLEQQKQKQQQLQRQRLREEQIKKQRQSKPRKKSKKGNVSPASTKKGKSQSPQQKSSLMLPKKNEAKKNKSKDAKPSQQIKINVIKVQNIKKSPRSNSNHTRNNIKKQDHQKLKVPQGQYDKNNSSDSDEGQQTKLQQSFVKHKKNRRKLISISIDKQTIAPNRRTSRPTYVNRKILFSGFMQSTPKRYFYIVENVQQPFDYLVMREYIRTYKALYAICKGIDIIKYQWFMLCQKFEKLISVEAYRFKQHPYLQESIQKVKRGFQVFKGVKFLLNSEKYHVKNEQIEQLIQLCGGEIIKNKAKLKGKQQNYSYAIVSNIQNEDHRQAMSDQLLKLKKLGYSKIYTVQMIMDSCERQQINQFANQIA